MSEVAIDKVVTEINGFRQRLAMLKEEYTRANRAMADKMAQLGENLTRRVRDLRDQVTNAPQNLLGLESRFMSGDIPEQEVPQTVLGRAVCLHAPRQPTSRTTTHQHGSGLSIFRICGLLRVATPGRTLFSPIRSRWNSPSTTLAQKDSSKIIGICFQDPLPVRVGF